jgi:hypothetical protein
MFPYYSHGLTTTNIIKGNTFATLFKD